MKIFRCARTTLGCSRHTCIPVAMSAHTAVQVVLSKRRQRETQAKAQLVRLPGPIATELIINLTINLTINHLTMHY